MYRFNPLVGTFELDTSKSKAKFAEKVSDLFSCDISTNIGDLVVPSTTIEDKVQSLTSNIYAGLVLGVVINKPKSDQCEVLATGKLSNISGIQFGKVMFVGEDGKLTTTPPATGHLQIMGMSLTSTTAFLLPSTTKVVRP